MAGVRRVGHLVKPVGFLLRVFSPMDPDGENERLPFEGLHLRANVTAELLRTKPRGADRVVEVSQGVDGNKRQVRVGNPVTGEGSFGEEALFVLHIWPYGVGPLLASLLLSWPFTGTQKSLDDGHSS
uniref:Uncharacterized protein n=1 Tax=Sphaerodactylus townsendi TaxID=933632 RepID=A0ACB8FL51_9SAUR